MALLNPLFYMLPMIIFLGIITSYEDIRHGKIRNKWIVAAVAYSLLANLLIFLSMSYSLGPDPRLGYFIELLGSVIVALIAGFIFWSVGLWSAGDAKLFAAYTSLIPLSAYKYGYIHFFASSSILLNTFVPFFIAYTVLLMAKTTLKNKIYYLKRSFEPKKLAMLFGFLYAFVWPIDLFFYYTNIPKNYFIVILFLFILIYALQSLLKKKHTMIILLLIALRVIFDSDALGLESIVIALSGVLLFALFRFFILYMGYDFFTKRVDIRLLKPGMIPAESVYLEKGEYKKDRTLNFSLLSYLIGSGKKNGPEEKKYILKSKGAGLEQNDVIKLKRLEPSLGFEHLRVYQTVPLAPYFFAGVLLTIICKGNMFIFLSLILT